VSDRVFIIAVACVGALAVLMLADNVRESSAPLYGPPTVDEETVMRQVEEGRLSFKEAAFYVVESEDPETAPGRETAAPSSDRPPVEGRNGGSKVDTNRGGTPEGSGEDDPERARPSGADAEKPPRRNPEGGTNPPGPTADEDGSQ
jgi:hypothetical protein